MLTKDLHENGMAAHTGRDKTIISLEDRYCRPHLRRDVEKFVRICAMCQKAKDNTQNIGLHSPLSVPDSIWKDLSMYFILGLSKIEGYVDSVLVMMCRFLKMSHFIPCKKTVNANFVASLFFKEITWLHVVPKYVTFGRNVKFISHF